MEKPLEPSQEDCCNSGCIPCIFDVYEKQLKLYTKYLENGELDANFSEENGISQLEYTKFIVVNKINLCENHTLIKFKRVSSDNRKVKWNSGDHFLLKYISNETTCTRAYTPFTDKVELRNACDFAIIIKKYDEGLVSPFLYSLKEGDTTLWRGPYGHFNLDCNKFDELIMIAQGTGITAFIDIIGNILSNENNITKIMLFYCCKSIETILFREELYKYKSYWNFRYKLFVSSYVISNVWYQEPINFKKISVADVALHSISNYDKCQILICGSLHFNECFKNNINQDMPSVKNIILF